MTLYVGACQLNSATVGRLSCHAEGSCAANIGDIGDESCQGLYSCFDNRGMIGNQSWYVPIYMSSDTLSILCKSYHVSSFCCCCSFVKYVVLEMMYAVVTKTILIVAHAIRPKIVVFVKQQGEN